MHGPCHAANACSRAQLTYIRMVRVRTQSAGGIAARVLSLCFLGAGSLLLDSSSPGARTTKTGGHEMKAGFASPFAHKRNTSRGGGELGLAESDVLDPVSVLVALDPKQV